MKKGLPRRRSNRVTSTSRGRTRVTSVDTLSMKRLDVASAIVPSVIYLPTSTIRTICMGDAQEKQKYYNTEFRKQNTQRHHLENCPIICPHCHAYMWKDELPAGES